MLLLLPLLLQLLSLRVLWTWLLLLLPLKPLLLLLPPLLLEPLPVVQRRPRRRLVLLLPLLELLVVVCSPRGPWRETLGPTLVACHRRHDSLAWAGMAVAACLEESVVVAVALLLGGVVLEAVISWLEAMVVVPAAAAPAAVASPPEQMVAVTAAVTSCLREVVAIVGVAPVATWPEEEILVTTAAVASWQEEIVVTVAGGVLNIWLVVLVTVAVVLLIGIWLEVLVVAVPAGMDAVAPLRLRLSPLRGEPPSQRVGHIWTTHSHTFRATTPMLTIWWGMVVPLARSMGFSEKGWVPRRLGKRVSNRGYSRMCNPVCSQGRSRRALEQRLEISLDSSSNSRNRYRYPRRKNLYSGTGSSTCRGSGRRSPRPTTTARAPSAGAPRRRPSAGHHPALPPAPPLALPRLLSPPCTRLHQDLLRPVVAAAATAAAAAPVRPRGCSETLGPQHRDLYPIGHCWRRPRLASRPLLSLPAAAVAAAAAVVVGAAVVGAVVVRAVAGVAGVAPVAVTAPAVFAMAVTVSAVVTAVAVAGVGATWVYAVAVGLMRSWERLPRPPAVGNTGDKTWGLWYHPECPREVNGMFLGMRVGVTGMGKLGMGLLASMTLSNDGLAYLVL